MMRAFIILVICLVETSSFFLVEDIYDYETNTSESEAVPLEFQYRGIYEVQQDLEYAYTSIATPSKFGQSNVPTVAEEKADVTFECIRMAPNEMFVTIAEVIKSASKGIEFIQEQSQKSDIWGELLSSYLQDEFFEGVILLARNQAVDIYEKYVEPYNNASRGQIAAFSFVPDALNVDTIGPIEFTAQGTSVQLYRDSYVETEDSKQSYVDTIIPFPSSCQDVEFWIIDRILVPPNQSVPATLPLKAEPPVEILQRDFLSTSLIENGIGHAYTQPQNSAATEMDIILDLESLDEVEQQQSPQGENLDGETQQSGYLKVLDGYVQLPKIERILN